LELIFSINLLSLNNFIKVLPILNSPRNPLSNGAGILEYIFYSISDGIIPLFLIAVLIMVLLFTNRVFCGWICPIGTFQDACAAIPANKRKVKPSTHKSLLKIKYVFVILIREMILTGSIQPLFSNFIVFFVFFFYIALIVLSVWYPRLYCRYICPFGAVASAVGEYSFLKLSRNPVKCVGRTECGICEKFCPKQIRMLDEPFEFFTGKGECNFCLKCKELCPHDAINIKFG
jgi:polyferredoxin